MIQSYKDLEVWKMSIEFVKEIYLITKQFPKEEQFGLVQQLKRAAISIPCNIAEGKMRGHRKEYIQFLYISLGSCGEVSTQLFIALELNYIDENTYNQLSAKIDHISRMIRNLIKSLKNEL